MNALGNARRLALASLGGTLALLAVISLVGQARGAPTELLFSEYLEGSGNNKALEIFNGTGSPVTLTGAYDVQIFANGSPTATATIPLVGTVAAGDVFVLARSSAVAAVLAQADQTTSNFLFNGNDAVALRKDGALVDVIGEIGVDPGVAWGSEDVATADHTLRRKPSVQAPDPNGADAFDPSLQWSGLTLDSFDGLGAHAVTLGPNDPPLAAADAASVEEDGGTISIAVLANDADPDGDPLVVVAVGEAENGVAEASADGASVLYAPDVDFNGTDSFTYTVSDGAGGEDVGVVTVTVEAGNDDPEPEDDAAATAEDVPVTVDVLANDADPDGDPLELAAVDGAEHGTATIAPGGTGVLYRPEADFNGVDSVEYAVADGQGGLETAELVVTVTPVNDPPVPGPDLASSGSSSPVVIDVLANDTPGPPDESTQPLAVTAVGAPQHGTAELLTDGPDAGKVRYVASAGFRGADSFTYELSDGESSAPGTVTVTVRPLTFRTLCALPATVLGTQGNDVLLGTPGDDVIRARRGDDVIDGNGGNDVVCGGPGADRITTLDGDDHVAAGTGNDTVDSGGGDDRLRGGVGRDAIASGPGDDSVAAGPGDDSVEAGGGRNRVNGGPGDDTLVAEAGNDRLDGGPGTDACDADGGRNRVLRCE